MELIYMKTKPVICTRTKDSHTTHTPRLAHKSLLVETMNECILKRSRFYIHAGSKLLSRGNCSQRIIVH